MVEYRPHSWVIVYFGAESLVVAAAARRGLGVGESGVATLASLMEDDATLGQLVLETIRSNPREVPMEDAKIVQARLREIGAMLGFPGRRAGAVADSALLEFDDAEVVATLWRAKPRGGEAHDTLRLQTSASDPVAVGSLIRQCHVRLER
jgi:hypothetical protein